MRLKERNCLHCSKVQVKARAVRETVMNDPENLGKITEEGAWAEGEILGVGKTTFSWMKMPLRSFLERSQCLASKLRRIEWFLLGVHVAGGLKLKPMLLYHLRNLRPLRMMLNILCPHSIYRTTKSGWSHICLQHDVLHILDTLEIYHMGGRKPVTSVKIISKFF